MKEAPSEHIHTTASAISSGLPKRPMGWRLSANFFRCRRAPETPTHRGFDCRRTHDVYPNGVSRDFERGGLG
jgi:hypothetical protein